MKSSCTLLVNACRRTRPITRALGLRLYEQRRGTQYYRARGSGYARGSGGVDADGIQMVNAHGDALDVCIRTAEFFGRQGNASREETPYTREDPVAVFLGEDAAVSSPSLAFAVEGPLLNHCYYPDMLVNSGFAEVHSKNSEEAAGFAAAISRLCGPHQVLIVLVHPETDRETLAETAEATASLAGSLRKVRPTTVALSDENYRRIAEKARSQGASTAETDRVVQAAHAAYVRGGDAAAILEAANRNYNARQLLEYYEQLYTGAG